MRIMGITNFSNNNLGLEFFFYNCHECNAKYPNGPKICIHYVVILGLYAKNINTIFFTLNLHSTE